MTVMINIAKLGKETMLLLFTSRFSLQLIFLCHLNIIYSQEWHTPLIPALGRQKQVDLCEFEASLVYILHKELQASQVQNETLVQTNKRTDINIYVKFTHQQVKQERK